MIYFLLRAESYRAWQHIGEGRLQGAPPVPPCVHVQLAHPLPPTCAQSPHTCVQAHSCAQQHVCTDCFKHPCHTVGHGGMWGGQQVGPPQAPSAKPRTPHPRVTLPADPVGRAIPISCPQTLFSAGWGAAGPCQMPCGSNERGWRPRPVGLAHTVLSPGPQKQPPPPLHVLPQALPAHVSPNTASLRQGPQCPKYPHTPCPAAAHGKRGLHVVAQGKGWEFGGAALQTAAVSHSRTARASPALPAFATARPLPSSQRVPDTA